MTTPVDYAAVLADLEARRAQLDAAIAAIRTMMGSAPAEGDEGFVLDAPVGAPIPLRPRTTTSGGPLQSDSFHRLSTPDAIRKYLTMMRRPQKLPDIARSLREGGQPHAIDAQSAYNNVYAAIKRMEKAGEVSKIKTGEWGLTEWYSTKSRPEGE
jgi:hypothetical protein